MTFEQAKHQKEEKLLEPTEYSGRGIKMGIYIVPKLNEDLLQYLKDFIDKNLDDDLVKSYSSNNEFSLYRRELQ